MHSLELWELWELWGLWGLWEQSLLAMAALGVHIRFCGYG